MKMLRQTMYEEIDLLKKRKVIYERLNYIRKIDTPKPNKKVPYSLQSLALILKKYLILKILRCKNAPKDRNK